MAQKVKSVKVGDLSAEDRKKYGVEGLPLTEAVAICVEAESAPEQPTTPAAE